ncbi:hypothetical protein [uncultured Pseudoteredinibacter sp.]|uniref:hypothetical protein n=1 Tax=uncultured Pseudoteredinibacter sp. TaxID=1641701 RepID=UPI0026362CC7|nr:hypothetical protein [uncultured Pseudoteredinibacter sp.]
MHNRLVSQHYIAPLIGGLLWIALSVSPTAAYAQTTAETEAETPTQSEKQNAERESSKQEDTGKPPPEGGKTIWLEEKLNPSTQWLEKAVKPLTRWIENQVQLDPKGSQKQRTTRPQAQQKSQATGQGSAENSQQNIHQGSGPRLSKDQIRKLVKQRYAGDVLHIKSLANARYRVKLISQQGVIQILYLSAIDGQELSP